MDSETLSARLYALEALVFAIAQQTDSETLAADLSEQRELCLSVFGAKSVSEKFLTTVEETLSRYETFLGLDKFRQPPESNTR